MTNEQKSGLVRALLLQIVGVAHSAVAWVRQGGTRPKGDTDDLVNVVLSHVDRLVDAGIPQKEANQYVPIAQKAFGDILDKFENEMRKELEIHGVSAGEINEELRKAGLEVEDAVHQMQKVNGWIN